MARGRMRSSLRWLAFPLVMALLVACGTPTRAGSAGDSHPDTAQPSGCAAATGYRFIDRFVTAFNGGDQAALARIVGPGFRRFAVAADTPDGATVIENHEALLAYFGERYARGERWEVVEAGGNQEESAPSASTRPPRTAPMISPRRRGQAP